MRDAEQRLQNNIENSSRTLSDKVNTSYFSPSQHIPSPVSKVRMIKKKKKNSNFKKWPRLYCKPLSLYAQMSLSVVLDWFM